MPDDRITWAEIANAYDWSTAGDDCPDVIYLMDGKCPRCRQVIAGEVIDECPHCGFPKRS